MTWQDALASSWLGQLIRGITKLVLAGAVAAILSAIDMDLSNITIGDVTVDMSIVWDLIRVFAPLLLIISGLRDLGVRL